MRCTAVEKRTPGNVAGEKSIYLYSYYLVYTMHGILMHLYKYAFTSSGPSIII